MRKQKLRVKDLLEIEEEMALRFEKIEKKLLTSVMPPKKIASLFLEYSGLLSSLKSLRLIITEKSKD